MPSSNSDSSSRKIWCSQYDECLLRAIALGWPGFACDRCEVDNPDLDFNAEEEAYRIKKMLEIAHRSDERVAQRYMEKMLRKALSHKEIIP